ncbi:MAG: alpha/beta fold hydrolase [Planctomycetes bacterium]|nr:alpha/beta fold hydrolase [Planctomycetota bacterium]MBL7043966.1 alpha/beta fold hydrolase [Pirellulaceae bacterium]
MSIVVACRCGKRFSAQPYLAGKRVNCPECGSPIAIPTPQPDPQQTPALEPLGTSSGDDFWNETIASTPTSPFAGKTAPASPAFGVSSPSKRQFKVWPFVVAGVVAAVLILVCGGGFLIWSKVSSFVGQEREWVSTLPEEDYADVRRSFRTDLVQRGAPPQEWEPLSTPDGAKRIDYRSGNLTLAAFVDPPLSDDSERPGLLFLHGGFAYGDGDWEMAQPYRDAGYVVMTPTLRGENGQSGKFTLYFDEVGDVLAAADALAALPYVDDEQIFVAGHSAGGSLAALAAMASDRFRAAASLSGCMDQRLNADIAPFRQSDEREFQVRSPRYYASSFKCPTRLYVGSQEILLASSAEGTATRARKAGLDVQAQRIPGDHFTSVTPAIRHSITFFRRHLKSGFTPRMTLPPIATPEVPSFEPPTFEPPTFEPPTSPVTPPTIPGPSSPSYTPPRPPSFTPPSHPSFSQSRAVVVFEILGYEGRMPKRSAARHALIRIPWVDPVRIEVNESAGTLTVGVRGRSVSTAAAKSALEQAGFQVGATTYKGQ